MHPKVGVHVVAVVDGTTWTTYIDGALNKVLSRETRV